MNWKVSSFVQNLFHRLFKSPRHQNSWACFFAGALLTLQPSQWTTLYSGQGEVHFTPKGLSLKPAAAQTPEQTHAALVLSQIQNARYFDLEIVFQNVQPLRQGNPQPWEVFWLFFNYQTDHQNQKKTNYLILKPNGLELGRATQEVHQDILKTWPQPISRFGQDHHLRLQRWSTKLIITLDQQPEVTYEFVKDAEKPFDQQGHIGLYCEDAEVLVKSVRYLPL